MLGTVWAERCQRRCNIVRWWNRKFWTMQVCEDPMRQLEHPFTLCDKDHFIPLHYQNTLHEGREFEPWVRDRFLCLHWQCQTCQTPLLGLLKEKCETDRRESERGGGREREGKREREEELGFWVGDVRVECYQCLTGGSGVLGGRQRDKKDGKKGVTRGKDKGKRPGQVGLD